MGGVKFVTVLRPRPYPNPRKKRVPSSGEVAKLRGASRNQGAKDPKERPIFQKEKARDGKVQSQGGKERGALQGFPEESQIT